MTNEIRNTVLITLRSNFTTEQLQMIDMAVAKALVGYKIEKEETLPAVVGSEIPVQIKEFLIRKELKGCSKGTYAQYEYILTDFAMRLQKNICEVKDTDILAYLDYRINTCGISARTANGNRLILSSFFTYMHDTGKMNYNPMKTVDPIKFKAKVREPLSDIELERVRNACETLREKALFEVLYSTGARVSEIVGLDWNQIDINSRSAIITGKGDQERHIFFNAKSLIAIDNYLKSRDDGNTALFVSEIAPHNRLTKSSIESIIKQIGVRSGIGRNIFPHLLRHTFATDMLAQGAKIDEVSEMLGHKKLETTKIYAKTSKTSLEAAHRRFAA